MRGESTATLDPQVADRGDHSTIARASFRRANSFSGCAPGRSPRIPPPEAMRPSAAFVPAAARDALITLAGYDFDWNAEEDRLQHPRGAPTASPAWP